MSGSMHCHPVQVHPWLRRELSRTVTASGPWDRVLVKSPEPQGRTKGSVRRRASDLPLSRDEGLGDLILVREQ